MENDFFNKDPVPGDEDYKSEIDSETISLNNIDNNKKVIILHCASAVTPADAEKVGSLLSKEGYLPIFTTNDVTLESADNFLNRLVGIKASVGKELLKEELSEAPEKIRAMELKTNVLNQAREKLQKQLKDIEIATLAAVSSELSADGKPVFSNDTKRQVEQKSRLDNNVSYTKIREELDKLDLESKTMSIELQYALNKFSSNKAIARLYE
jgi:hypothetical protein